MKARLVWVTAIKDWRRLQRDPFSLAVWLAIPLILAVLMNLVFGGRQPVPQGRLLVADEDGTIASGMLTAVFGRDPINKMVLVEKVSRQQGQARMDRGDASALLIVPPGFQDAYLRDQPFHLQLITNPAQHILPRMIEQALSITISAGFYLHHMTAMVAASPPSGRTIAQQAAAIYGLVADLVRYLNPPLIGIETAVTAETAPTQSFASLFFPSIIFLALLMMANALAIDIWKERTLGTLRRLAVAPYPLQAFLFGRLVFVISVFGVVALAGLAAARWVAGMPVANLPAAVLWMALSGTAFFLLYLLLTLYATGPREANLLGNVLLFPLSLLGGCFFPFEAMPAWMVSIGRWTPNGWAVLHFKAILSGQASSAGVSIAAAGLVAMSALAFALSLRRLRQGMPL
jgi:ABC-type multidrug transport system permease subunit